MCEVTKRRKVTVKAVHLIKTSVLIPGLKLSYVEGNKTKDVTKLRKYLSAREEPNTVLIFHYL